MADFPAPGAVPVNESLRHSQVHRAMAAPIRASVGYVLRSPAHLYDFNYEPPSGTLRSSVVIDHHRVLIDDARLVDDLDLQKSGFEHVSHRSALTQWDQFQDSSAVADIYYAEVRNFLVKHLRADDAVVFDHTLRDSGVQRGSASLREPVGRVHNDQTFQSAPKRLTRFLSQGDSAGRLARRFAIVNFWRPVEGPVVRSPLAICDWRSVHLADLMPTELKYPDWTGETFSVAFNPSHRWYWYPDQPSDVVTLLKVFDSDASGVARMAPHTAFELDNSHASAPNRRSIEVRAFVFW